MKKLSIITAALVCAAAVTVCAAPSVRWLDTEYNFGAFDEDYGPVTHDFKFVNDGSEPVTILAARASCGCTTPRYPRTPIAVGDTGVISVTYDPAGRPGRFTKYVGVELSYEGSKNKLIVSGTVVGSAGSVSRRFPVDCGSGLQLNRAGAVFGQMKKGSLRTVNLEAYNRTSEPMCPSVKGLPDYIDVTIVPDTVMPGEQMSMIFYMRSNKCPLYGLVSDTVYLAHSPSASEMCPIPVMAVIEEDFSKLSPSQLAKAPVATVEEESIDFGKISGTEVLTRTFSVKNSGKSVLNIRRVYSADEGVTVDVEKDSLKPGKSTVVTVSVDPSKLSGSMLNARVALITNDPAKPTRNIRLVGLL